MQCGCSNVCTGRRKGSKSGYDADSREKPGPPEQKDCSPPDTSAAFQDACTESGQALRLRRHEGYDHSYYFIQTFVKAHLKHHAKLLGA